MNRFYRKLLVVLGLSFYCLAPSAKTYQVDVTAIVDHPSLELIRQGVKKALEDEGFDEKILNFKYQSAQGNQSIASQVARQFVGESPDVIVAITTPSAQTMMSANKSIPMVFVAVTDPVSAKLVKTMDEPTGRHITGVSDALDMKKQAEFLLQVMPDLKHLGIVYNPGEINSVSNVSELKKYLKEYGVELLEATATRSAEVAQAARSLVGEVDAFIMNKDNTVASSLETYIQLTREAKIPLFAMDPESVERGVLGSYGVESFNNGYQAGKLVVRVLRGENPGHIKPQAPEHYVMTLNLKAADAIGFKYPQEILDKADRLIK